MKKIKIKHPDWLVHSKPGKTIQMIVDGQMPEPIAGWMLVVSLKHPLRAVYGTDLRAAWALLMSAICGAIESRWRDLSFRVRKRFDLLDEDEREALNDIQTGRVQ